MTRPATSGQARPIRDVPIRNVPAGDLEQRDDAELLDLVRSLPRESPLRETACEVLVNRYRPLVRSCVRRFQNSPEPYEDLLQVGYVGLIKAINNYDPDAGTGLAGYALPCVSGEIKRYFRDKRWQVHVKRSLQELRLAARSSTAELTQDLGHAPSDAELAERLNIHRGGASRGQARRAGVPVVVARRADDGRGWPGQPGRPDRDRGSAARAGARHGGGLAALGRPA
jgi:RNA polymerase sigma factor (sigma-70 family)